MATVLYIYTNPKDHSESNTLKVSNAFVETYKAAHPDDEVVTLDLDAMDVAPHTVETLATIRDEGSVSHTLATQLKSADKYVFAAPFWNFGLPARMKAYIDHVVVAGVTFEYGEAGPTGLLENKKSVFITARGGDYREDPMSQMDFAVPYMQSILGFLGVTDHTTLTAEGMMMGEGVEERLAEAVTTAESAAKDW